jgi:20S proteasome subunit beta 1
MTKEECKDFVKKSISHAMARDGSSGGIIRLVIISKDGVEKEVVLGDKLPFLP